MFHYYCRFLNILFVQDLELLKADICQPEEETKTLLKTVSIKQEVQVSPVNKLLLLVLWMVLLCTHCILVKFL